jgi:uncharacterized membrane protein
VNFRILNTIEKDNGDYEATLEGYADAQRLWSRTAKVSSEHASKSRQTIYGLT